MTDGLKEAHRQAVIAEIAANERVERAVLFGSRATGTNTVTSDVDIALFGNRLTLTDQAQLAAALDEIPMAQSVDLLLYNSIRDRTLREHIRRQGVELYARPSRRAPSRRTRTANTCAAVMRNDIESVHWRRCEVADLIRDGSLVVGDGYRAKNSELAVSGLPFARAGNIADGFRFSDADRFPGDRLHRVGDKTSRPGDVVFTSKGTVGRFAFVSRDTEHFVYSPQLCYWRSLDHEVVDSYFLYCWVRGREFLRQFRSVAGQTDMAEYVSLTDQRDMFITLPPIAEQRTIARVLRNMDDKIELNRRMNETLEATAWAMFKSWFLDFDPVRAKMEGRETTLPYELADLFPDRLLDSEIGEIPEGWEVIPLDAIARFQNGLALQKFRPAPNEERLPVVKIAQLRVGEANSREWASTAIKPECIIEDGDVLFSWSGSLVVKTWCGGQAALNQHLFKVTSERYPKWFYLHSLLSHLPAFRRIAQDKATTMGHIRRHHLTDALCVASPDGVIARLSDTFSCLLEGQVANELSSRTHVALRDTLLPKLISGEVRVPDAERALEAAT